MVLNTASAIISFYSKLEDRIAKFYEDQALNDKCSEVRETFLAFAEEGRKHRDAVLRAYREVITDAIETGFSFSGLHESDYEINTELMDDLSFFDILKKAIDVEEKSYKFCTDVSESSRALLADITHAFGWVAKRKAKRKLILESLLDEQKNV